MTPWHRHLPDDLDPADVDLGAGGTLPAVWAAHWRTDPSRPVLHDTREGWIDGETLDRRSDLVARRLAAAGVERGDRVILSAPSSVGLVVAHAALLRLGAVVMPTNGAYRSDEVGHVVSDARPTAAIVGDPSWEAWIHDVDPSVTVVSPAIELPDGPAVELDRSEPDDPALIGYTSGTTGRPKGAVLSHRNLLASVRGLELAWRWTPDDLLILALPLFHMHGLGVERNVQARADSDRLKIELEGTVLTAPFAGVVSGMELDQGEHVHAKSCLERGVLEELVQNFVGLCAPF